MAEQAQAVGIDGQRQLVVEEEMAEMFEMVPSGVGGDKKGGEQFCPHRHH